MMRVLQSLAAVCVVVALSSTASAFSVSGETSVSGGSVTVAAPLPGPGGNVASKLTVEGIGDFNGTEEGFEVTLLGRGGSETFTVWGEGGIVSPGTATTLTAMFNISAAELDALSSFGDIAVIFDGFGTVGQPYPTQYSATLAAVPEPASLSLLAIGGVVAGVYRRRRRA